MLGIGLTGGIGSGKSTVADMFCQHGAVLIDADAISRRVTASGGLAIDAIANEFGAGFIAADGALDRARMRKASFADSAVRARLEAIIHPLVRQESARLEGQAVDSGARFIVFDIPLLVESQQSRQRFDQVVVVDCVAEVQIARVMARSALAREEIEAIIASQASRLARLRAADLVIFNAGPSLERIADDVSQIVRRFGL